MSKERISLSTYRSGSGGLSCRQVARIVADHYDDGSPCFALVAVIAIRIVMRVVVIVMMIVVAVMIIVVVMVTVVMKRLMMLLIIAVSFRHRTQSSSYIKRKKGLNGGFFIASHYGYFK